MVILIARSPFTLKKKILSLYEQPTLINVSTSLFFSATIDALFIDRLTDITLVNFSAAATSLLQQQGKRFANHSVKGGIGVRAPSDLRSGDLIAQKKTKQFLKA